MTEYSIPNINDDILDILSQKDIEDLVRMEKYNKYQKEYYKKRTKCRNKGLDPDSTSGIGYMTEALVSKFLGIPTCFEVTGNFSYPKYDILEHKDFGKINAKGATLCTIRKYSHWAFCTKKNKRPDFFFCIGYDHPRENVLAVYYIPNDNNICNANTIYVNANWTPEEDPYHWFKQDVKPWNDLFHSLKLENCPILRSYHK